MYICVWGERFQTFRSIVQHRHTSMITQKPKWMGSWEARPTVLEEGRTIFASLSLVIWLSPCGLRQTIILPAVMQNAYSCHEHQREERAPICICVFLERLSGSGLRSHSTGQITLDCSRFHSAKTQRCLVQCGAYDSHAESRCLGQNTRDRLVCSFAFALFCMFVCSRRLLSSSHIDLPGRSTTSSRRFSGCSNLIPLGVLSHRSSCPTSS
ncbi:hypothetical protein SISSUDRAFT_90015 [Sistotremastrum suecicum HHB10207 ss-3]|uniref:Uncharacterized protein n=1 Tax=Sistotremastrum suecicum HHB10207 ss-3 TaxID=1314776 RepID=A0A166BAS3_9AGAM|nr:hypothetical protein SISSUDRAFT_90015 [Sistotremastrum suecicum HHB10207 ss-3]